MLNYFNCTLSNFTVLDSTSRGVKNCVKSIASYSNFSSSFFHPFFYLSFVSALLQKQYAANRQTISTEIYQYVPTYALSAISDCNHVFAVNTF